MPHAMKFFGCDPQHIRGHVGAHAKNNYGGAVTRLNLSTGRAGAATVSGEDPCGRLGRAIGPVLRLLQFNGASLA
jgi:hypothetical protein